MIRIAIIADLHANFPAAQKVLERALELKCDHVYHLGDAISIGPHPKECIELLQKNKVTLLMGNHEEYFVKGLSKPQPHYMSDGEYLHQKWTHSQLKKGMKEWLSGLPYIIQEVFQNVSLAFLHSPVLSEEKYKDFQDLRKCNKMDLDAIFDPYDSDIICYGHSHISSDIEGRKRYINPGSVGCHTGNYAKLSVVEIRDNSYDVHHYRIKYNKQSLLSDMTTREVPDKEFICKTFFKE